MYACSQSNDLGLASFVLHEGFQSIFDWASVRRHPEHPLRGAVDNSNKEIFGLFLKSIEDMTEHADRDRLLLYGLSLSRGWYFLDGFRELVPYMHRLNKEYVLDAIAQVDGAVEAVTLPHGPYDLQEVINSSEGTTLGTTYFDEPS